MQPTNSSPAAEWSMKGELAEIQVGFDGDRFSDSNQFVMKTYSVTEAKAKLGPLADMALKKRPIFIRRGQRILQLVEATLPEPIPHFPEGHFAVGEDRAEYLNSLPTDPSPLER